MEVLGNDICIRYIKLPYRCGGFTIMDEDCFYNVYLNSLLPREKQLSTLKHELYHIRNDHFFLDIPTELKEKLANENC